MARLKKAASVKKLSGKEKGPGSLTLPGFPILVEVAGFEPAAFWSRTGHHPTKNNRGYMYIFPVTSVTSFFSAEFLPYYATGNTLYDFSVTFC